MSETDDSWIFVALAGFVLFVGVGGFFVMEMDHRLDVLEASEPKLECHNETQSISVTSMARGECIGLGLDWKDHYSQSVCNINIIKEVCR